MSGSVGGAVATVTSFPFDVLRTRMIGQGEPKVQAIYSTTDHLRVIIPY